MSKCIDDNLKLSSTWSQDFVAATCTLGALACSLQASWQENNIACTGFDEQPWRATYRWDEGSC